MSSPSPHAALWPLERGLAFLNHGSFGACPTEVLRHQSALRAEMEAEPVRFLSRELDDRLDAARTALAAFVGAAPEDLAFVTNATSGVNAVLRSLPLGPDDELLTTDHAYKACWNTLEFVAERARARVVVAPIPFPLSSPDEVVGAVLSRVTARTRLALLDHVTSPTALILPIERLIAELGRRGIDVLVDGAHAPGMLPLDLGALGAAYYSGNCHKWLCAPKGSAFLWVRRDRRQRGPAAHHQPRRRGDASRTARASTSSSTGRARATRRPGSPCRRRSTTSARSSRAAGPR